MIFNSSIINSTMNQKIKHYINKQKAPQKLMIIRLRKLFLKTLPTVKEQFKWGVITFSDGKYYLAAIKNKVHIGFAINGLSKKEIDMFEGSGKSMRHIKIHSLSDINEKKLVKLIKLVNNKSICKPC